MPKRSYPFDGVCPLQLKTHVGQKELSQGVLGEQYKREIFERTKKLLFSGAKAVMGSLGNQSEKEREDGAAHELLTGQTIIGQDGKLHRSAQKPLTVGAAKACAFCVRSVGEKEACSQCERSVCKSCSTSCSCCAAVMCSFCTVLIDGDPTEQVFCSACSVFEV
ncbi:apoptosis regulatory protein Siva [Spea bombifrons]|uniref:apoptosis regulatory protein Siva n=1 Tax=Spea bombifrons TaxID=233779 RepID=UPI002348FBD7|nr:apoptosis regulatory protein Siva [Spea bombifrons]